MRRVAYIVVLVMAGEMVFSLPFHTTRFFRPTLLEVFGFTNTQLGDLFAVYGITAMLSYFPGGPLADRFSARSLLSVALIATSAGGLYMATIPGAAQMAALYGYWGVTTIFLLWGALIRATREWGGLKSQGTAFGILDGGRGLVAALFAAFAVAVLAWYLPDNVAEATGEDRRAGLQSVILLYSAATFLTGVLAWFAIPLPAEPLSPRGSPFTGIREVLRRPVIWAQAGVIVAAYCCYKGLDNYSLYAVQVLGMNELEAARLATYGAYLRPAAAVAAGLIADRFSVSRSLGVAFLLLVVSYGMLSISRPETSTMLFIYSNLIVSFVAVFALRGIYFALLEENDTPRFLTGTAVGVVSFIGFTPEIFFASIAGRILDASPGVEGHLDYFAFLAGIAVCGALVVGWLLWLNRNNRRRGPVY